MVDKAKKLSSTMGRLSSDRRLMLFDLSLGGHHGNYIQHLINYWCEHDLTGSLKIVVPPQFLQVHADVITALSKYQHPAVELITITKAEEAALVDRSSGFNRTRRNFQEWNLYQKYAVSLRANHSLLMYFDTCELPLASGRSSPCPFSGIYFRPTFHYHHFANYVPSRKQKLQQLREKVILSRILHHPQLSTLFCLDPFAVKHFDQFHTQANVAYLPDPVHLEPCSTEQIEQLRKRLRVESGRQVFLLFGALDGRKGIYQLLEAIAQLPKQLAQKVCLLLVGATGTGEKTLLQPLIETLRQEQFAQIVEQYEFVSEPEVAVYFQLSDVVLAPYQRHVGMSGILLLAAAAGKPVLSSDYGLMGTIVQQHNLGLVVDSTQPEEIAKGLTQFLQHYPKDWVDPYLMHSFAEEHTFEQFASTIFQNLM